MSVLHSLCQYCQHRSSGAESTCAHCGAPLEPAAAHSGLPGLRKVVADAERVAARAAGGAVAEVGKTVTGVERTARSLLTRYPAALAGIVVLAVFAFAILRWCSPALLPLGTTSPAGLLPASLRVALSCPDSAAADADQCVLSAHDALLAGGLSRGRDLSLTIRVVSQDRMTADIGRWRAAGASIVSDGAVFASIAPTMALWYADTRTGLRIETAPFADQSAARTFLRRAALTG
ncbi:hypothetical protein [Nocardia tengchongensis]|uniref:hypothetical protein n=1 Tax=Nocardia tengchongensis TaxID=2055889 RepID=UPI003621FC37